MAAEIRERFIEIRQRIHAAEERAGRKTDSVKLVVVTKGQSVENIVEVIAAGATCIGENYPEETHQKITQIRIVNSSIELHMIGHLQSRKIKYIVDDFSMIHSIDGVDIARELNAKLQLAQKTLPALLEVNLSGEESKHGFDGCEEKNWPELVDQWSLLWTQLPSLDFIGLMTMPPFTEDPENSRQYFRKCKRLLTFVQEHSGKTAFDQLSMGTSLDYEAAVEEGATFVRIGEAIMGKRIYR
jgi:PLP dependent protein